MAESTQPACIPERGTVWHEANLIWGERGGNGDTQDAFSPLDGSLLQSVHLLSATEEEKLFSPCVPQSQLENDAVFEFARHLHRELETLLPSLIEARQWETGFTRRDCQELQEGTLAYVSGFEEYFKGIASAAPPDSFYEVDAHSRRIQLVTSPWGTVALVLPQNASVLVGVTGLLNALITGNRIILRPPLQCVRSAAILALSVEKALFQSAPSLRQRISIVMARARPFLQAVCAAPFPAFIHYMGSSDHAPPVIADAFAGGKGVIADGTGNVWVYVGQDADPALVSETLAAGATRYNGQTCTSINGALIHPAIYSEVVQQLKERLQALRVGSPLDAATEVGPLFDEKQTDWCKTQIQESGGTVLCGGGKDDNILQPTLVEEPNRDSSLVREGIFGPALWVGSGDSDAFFELWSANRYPLCAGILAPSLPNDQALSQLHGVARLVVNGDPSVEHIYEPWGAYPSSGLNIVGHWHHKYQRVISLDTRTDKGPA
jgi:glyceraldehyde-3-phosphate dehydrogenase (NADP+)